MFTDIHLINLRIMAEVLAACHMLGHFLPHREHYPLRLLAGSVLSLMLAWLFPVPDFALKEYVPWGLLMYGSIFAMGIGTLGLCYQESFLSVCCCGITGYTIHQMGSALSGTLEQISQLLELNWPPAAMWLGASVPVFMICYRMLAGKIRDNGHIRIDSRMLPMLSVAVLLVDILSGLFLMQFQTSYSAPAYEIMIQLLNMLACAFILSIQDGLISNRELKTELEVVSGMLQEEKRQYENSRRNIEVINQKCHDLKHQLRTLRKQDGEVDRTVLKEIEQAVDIYDTSVQTGSAALDVILTEKKLLCESHQIPLTCLADGSGLEKISAPDIYALFGNALDNAIEAVTQLNNPEEKGISLSVRRQAGMTVIRVENRFSGELKMEDGLPQTTKGDRDYHGFGMKSMKTIAEKYGGCVTASAGDHIFSLSIMLPA